MERLVGPGVNFVNSANVEQAMVTGQVVGDVVTAGAARVNELVVRREALEDLQDAYRAAGRVTALSAEVDARSSTWPPLRRGRCCGRQRGEEANAADAAHREALSAVDAAQAREEERKTSGGESTDDHDTAARGGRGDADYDDDTGDAGNHRRWRWERWRWWDFPPSVEQWRSLVQAYFPSSVSRRRWPSCNVRASETPMPTTPTRAPRASSNSSLDLGFHLPQAGFAGASVFDGEANIGTAAWLANRYQELGKGYWTPWSCRRVLG